MLECIAKNTRIKYKSTAFIHKITKSIKLYQRIHWSKNLVRSSVPLPHLLANICSPIDHINNQLAENYKWLCAVCVTTMRHHHISWESLHPTRRSWQGANRHIHTTTTTTTTKTTQANTIDVWRVIHTHTQNKGTSDRRKKGSGWKKTECTKCSV